MFSVHCSSLLKRLVLGALTFTFAVSLLLADVATAQVKFPSFYMSDTPDGPPMTDFPSGTSVVYVIFEYTEAEDTPIQVRVYDPKGQILLKETKNYTGEGREVAEVASEAGAYLDGAYLSQVRVGEEQYLADSEEWFVGEVPTPEAEIPVIVQAPDTSPSPSSSSPSGPSAVMIAGIVVLLLVLIALVVWAIRGFITAS
jgi:hypothetical protein